MTTGAIIFLALIAAFILVLGLVVIYQYCDIKVSIDQSEINRRTEFEEVKSAIDKSVKGCRNTIDSGYNNEAKYLLYGFEKEFNLKSESVSKSGLSPESATPNGTITPPSSLSDIELRKYCIEQTRKDQVYLRIEDAQRLYEYILNGRQERKEESNGEF
ncbi:hypothetical protein O1444_20235 [Bacteroides fragilis]|uniref:hypothetical protein n=1 Tax=Bacteroides fragilis TaxID=817 RepID=UPI0022AA7A35|nr:hypothetical protein [Bacteroides fragilis]MCZ2539481.1 hypothetical protein [Bacteroides fragilis]MCZ2639104.1 hypothetical protein [Bacteroides fragilis]